LRPWAQCHRKIAYGDIVGKHVETARSTCSPILYTLRPASREASKEAFGCDQRQADAVELSHRALDIRESWCQKGVQHDE
jgi:hypothetical protein